MPSLPLLSWRPVPPDSASVSTSKGANYSGRGTLRKPIFPALESFSLGIMLRALLQRWSELKVFYGAMAFISLLRYVIVNPRHLGKTEPAWKSWVFFLDN